MRRYDSNLENAVPEARFNATYANGPFPRRTCDVSRETCSLARVKVAISREVSIAGSLRSAPLSTRGHRRFYRRCAHCSSWNIVLSGFFPVGFVRAPLGFVCAKSQTGCTKSSTKSGMAPHELDGKLSRSDRFLRRDFPKHSRYIDLVAGRFTRDCLPGGNPDRSRRRTELPHRGIPPGARVPFVEIKRRQTPDGRPIFNDT